MSSKSLIFLEKSFLGHFYTHLATFNWSHWLPSTKYVSKIQTPTQQDSCHSQKLFFKCLCMSNADSVTRLATNLCKTNKSWVRPDWAIFESSGWKIMLQISPNKRWFLRKSTLANFWQLLEHLGSYFSSLNLVTMSVEFAKRFTNLMSGLIEVLSALPNDFG